MLSDRVAVFVVFAINGSALGSWAPRAPALAARIGAEPGTFGLALLGASVGMILAASLTGRIVQRFGSRAVVLASGLAGCALLPVVGSATSVPTLAAALFGLGAATGVLDVAMNVAGSFVERASGKAIMPIFHAGFSFGGLIGSAAAGLAASSDWSTPLHLGVAGIVAAVVLCAVVHPLPAGRSVAQPPSESAAPPARPLVRRPLLWLLAAVALSSAIAEGASADWSALLMSTAHGVGEGAAALVYSGFSLAMGLARLAGGWAQTRLGHTRLLVGGASVGAVGLLMAAAVPVPAAGYLGFALAGVGLAASFPVALSLAGEAGQRSDGGGGEREIGFVTTIAYSGFLGGPPLIGWLAQLTSVAGAFWVVAAFAALIVPAALGARRLGRAERRQVCV